MMHPTTGLFYAVDQETKAVYGTFGSDLQARIFAGWLGDDPARSGYPLTTHCDRCQSGPRRCRHDATWGVVCPNCDALMRCAACILVLPLGLLRRGLDVDEKRRRRKVVTRPLCPRCVERDRAGLLRAAS